MMKEIAAVNVRGQEYIRIDDVLAQIVEAEFGGDLKTEEQFNEAMAATQQAILDMGYEGAYTLSPPDVPFLQRGEYARARPRPTLQLMEDAIKRQEENAGWSYYIGERQLDMKAVIRGAGDAIGYRIDFHTDQGKAFEVESYKLLREAGYTIKERDSWSVIAQPTEFDRDAFDHAVKQKLCNTQDYVPALAWSEVVGRAIYAAYGNNLDDTRSIPDGVPLDEEQVSEALAAHGWHAVSPQRLERIPPSQKDMGNAIGLVVEAIGTMRVYNSKRGPYLYVPEVDKVVEGAVRRFNLPNDALNGVRDAALRRTGYSSHSMYSTVEEGHPIPDEDRGYRNFNGYHSAVAVKVDDEARLNFADKIGVYAPVFVRDDVDESRIVFIHMIGDAEAVMANRAALLINDKTHWVAGGRVSHDKKHNPTLLRGSLPSGMHEMVLYDGSLSISTMKEGHDFYCLANPDDPLAPPADFAYKLDKAIRAPFHHSWVPTLWEKAVEDATARMLTKKSWGMAIWKIEADLSWWELTIQTLLKEGIIAIPLEEAVVTTTIRDNDDDEDGVIEVAKPQAPSRFPLAESLMFPPQRWVLTNEEHQGVLERLEKRLEEMPPIRGTKDQDDPMVYAHIFGGHADLYVIEWSDDEIYCYGSLVANGTDEVGYQYIDALHEVSAEVPISHRLELDFYFVPRRLSEIKQKRGGHK